MERHKSEEVARRVIERVEGVVKEAIIELEGKESGVFPGSNPGAVPEEVKGWEHAVSNAP